MNSEFFDEGTEKKEGFVKKTCNSVKTWFNEHKEGTVLGGICFATLGAMALIAHKTCGDIAGSGIELAHKVGVIEGENMAYSKIIDKFIEKEEPLDPK